MAKAAEYNLDSEALFVSGFSGGGVGSLYASLGTQENFTDEIFQTMGDINSFSIYPDQEFDIKAVSTLAGGILDPSSTSYKIVGDVIDESDADIRFLMLHGQDDTAVKADIGPLQWVDPGQVLQGSRIASAINIKDKMDEKGIENKVVINCSAGHSIITYPCVFNDDDFTNNPKFSIGLPPECLKWALPENYSEYDYANLCNTSNARPFFNELGYAMMQFHDIAKITAAYFYEDVIPSGPAKNVDEFIDELLSDSEISTVLPQDFPYVENSNQLQNGHLELSERCLSQECTALYFDKLGIGNSALILGDFLQFKGSNLSIFNDDFTLELKVKEINHIGKGVLFSHLNNFNFGFELFINNSGFLQFKKNVGGGGSITGEKTLLDGECHHVAVQRKGNEFSLYLDGVLQEEPKTWNLDFPSSTRIRIGNTGNDLENGNNGFNGAVHSIKFWDQVIDVNEFEQTDLPINTPGLVGDFIFDQRFGQDIVSTNSLHTVTLGNNENNTNYDPRWMSDDIQCEFSESCILINSTEENDLIEFNIFPNPSTGILNIQFETYQDRAIEIYSIDGKLVKTISTDHSYIEVILENTGLYIVKVQDGNSINSKKVLIQK
jgi:hypothetical protein